MIVMMPTPAAAAAPVPPHQRCQTSADTVRCALGRRTGFLDYWFKKDSLWLSEELDSVQHSPCSKHGLPSITMALITSGRSCLILQVASAFNETMEQAAERVVTLQVTQKTTAQPKRRHAGSIRHGCAPGVAIISLSCAPGSCFARHKCCCLAPVRPPQLDGHPVDPPGTEGPYSCTLQSALQLHPPLLLHRARWRSSTRRS